MYIRKVMVKELMKNKHCLFITYKMFIFLIFSCIYVLAFSVQLQDSYLFCFNIAILLRKNCFHWNKMHPFNIFNCIIYDIELLTNSFDRLSYIIISSTVNDGITMLHVSGYNVLFIYDMIIYLYLAMLFVSSVFLCLNFRIPKSILYSYKFLLLL